MKQRSISSMGIKNLSSSSLKQRSISSTVIRNLSSSSPTRSSGRGIKNLSAAVVDHRGDGAAPTFSSSSSSSKRIMTSRNGRFGDRSVAPFSSSSFSSSSSSSSSGPLGAGGVGGPAESFPPPSASSDDDNDEEDYRRPPPPLLAKDRAAISRRFAGVTSGLASLSGSPPELWKAYLLKFLDSYSYFSFSLVLTLFLSDEFGMTDVQAGTVYGAWGALITIFGLVTGTVIDNLGVAKCLRIGFVLSLLTRIVLFLTNSRVVLLVCLLVTLPLGNCLGIPVLTVGIRRYTTEENRGFAFGLYYVVMNVGALVAGPLVDALTMHYNRKNEGGSGNGFGHGGDDTADDDNDVNYEGSVEDASSSSSSSWVMTTNRAIILSGAVANLIAVLVAFTVREVRVDPRKSSSNDYSSALHARQETDDDGGCLVTAADDEDPFQDSDVLANSKNDRSSKKSPNGVSKFQPMRGSFFQILSDTLRTPNFRRFLLVCLLTINVRMVFRHLDGTLPKYMKREFGENAPKGKVYAINPAMIIILVPIITAATSSVDPLVMIHWGTYVSALSVFFLAFSTSLWACVMFVVTLSLGESLWSPRLYDYTTSVAQEGREGTYMALSSAPLFLAKLPVGFISGKLLQSYCPEHLEEGEVRHSKTMWQIIALSTIISPIMITLLWGYISGGGSSRGNNEERLIIDGSDKSTIEGENGIEDDSTGESSSLTSNISLPRVRQAERPFMR
ncbi:hypothetical protein ACHAW5_004639 [Stephanodiscus triporus]|uniref:Major facilitator superfamily (MFS) profile domain-containing protein n=1 Tax=Stephanodiscus triporus TaxID=2934178 RepID=A0ABD3MIU7_9STRA